MGVLNCPECDGKVSERLDACPQCGFPVVGRRENPRQEPSEHRIRHKEAPPVTRNNEKVPVTCNNCGKVWTLSPSRCQLKEDGYVIDPPLLCMCGNTLHQSTLSDVPSPPQSRVQKKESSGGGIGKLVTWGMAIVVAWFCWTVVDSLFDPGSTVGFGRAEPTTVEEARSWIVDEWTARPEFGEFPRFLEYYSDCDYENSGRLGNPAKDALTINRDGTASLVLSCAQKWFWDDDFVETPPKRDCQGTYEYFPNEEYLIKVNLGCVSDVLRVSYGGTVPESRKDHYTFTLQWNGDGWENPARGTVWPLPHPHVGPTEPDKMWAPPVGEWLAKFERNGYPCASNYIESTLTIREDGSVALEVRCRSAKSAVESCTGTYDVYPNVENSLLLNLYCETFDKDRGGNVIREGGERMELRWNGVVWRNTWDGAPMDGLEIWR